jgi:hypothetical protein
VESRLRELAERLEARGGSLSPEMLAALDRQVRQAERLLQAGEGV